MGTASPWGIKPSPKLFLFTNTKTKLHNFSSLQLQKDLHTILWFISTVTVNLSSSLHWFAGGNAKLRYQITSGNTGGVFDVEPEVGTIFIAQPLDYEQNKR